MYTKKLAIIGSGNMAVALIKGLLKSNIISPENIMSTDINEDRLKKLEKEYSVRISSDNKKAVEWADVVLLAIKPQILKNVLIEVKNEIKDKLIVSIVAAIATEEIEKILGDKQKVIRVMPNVAVSVMEGTSVVCYGKYITKEDSSFVSELFKGVGMVREIKEDIMDAVTALSGTGPMYVFLTIEALTDAGINVGLSREDALPLSIQTVFGSSKMVMECDEDPESLKSLVTSPGGTSISALHSLEKAGIKKMFKDAIEAATNRAAEIRRTIHEKNSE